MILNDSFRPEDSQAIIPMVTCYEKAGKITALIDFLKQTLSEHPRISITLILAQQIANEKSLDQAIDFVTTYLRQHPSIRGLNQLIEWHYHNRNRHSYILPYYLARNTFQNIGTF